MTNSHKGYLVPVSRDLDGTLLVRCGVDGISGAPSRRIAVSLFCPDCHSVVGDIVPGSLNVDLDVNTPAADALLTLEPALAAAHRHAVAVLYARIGYVPPA